MKDAGRPCGGAPETCAVNTLTRSRYGQPTTCRDERRILSLSLLITPAAAKPPAMGELGRLDVDLGAISTTVIRYATPRLLRHAGRGLDVRLAPASRNPDQDRPPPDRRRQRCFRSPAHSASYRACRSGPDAVTGTVGAAAHRRDSKDIFRRLLAVSTPQIRHLRAPPLRVKRSSNWRST